MSYYAAAVAREVATLGSLSVDLRDEVGLRAARKACEAIVRGRQRRENALAGRSEAIEKGWVFQPGDEAICVATGRRARPALRHRVARRGDRLAAWRAGPSPRTAGATSR